MKTCILTDQLLKEGQIPKPEINSRLRKLENLIYLLLVIWFVSAILLVSFTTEGKTLAGNVAAAMKKTVTKKKKVDYLTGKDNSMAQQYLNKGWKCFLEGKNNQAMSCCSIALRENPHYAPAYALKSCIYEEMGHTEKAVQEMDKTILLDPDRRDIYIAIRRNIKDRGQQSATL